MTKKNIHVALDPEMLAAIDAWTREEGMTRADFIRAACQRQLERPTTRQQQESDAEYGEAYRQKPEESDTEEWPAHWPKRLGDDAEAYRRMPESTEVGDFQLAVLKDILPDEEW